MPMFTLTVKHGRTLEDARLQLEQAVTEVQTKFAAMVQRVEWAPDRNSVKVQGSGVNIELRVDATNVHAEGDLPLLGALLGAPLLAGLQGIMERRFQRLPGPSGRSS